MAFQNPYSARLSEFSTFVFNEPEHPESWDRLFLSRLGKAPVRRILEIGCSNAEFLTTVAAAHPDHAYVGLDWKFKIIYKGAQKIERQKLKNVALLRWKAQDVAFLFGPASLDEVWIFFPDPWAKKPQLKHRLIRESFLLDLRKTLSPGGRVYIKTDHPGYFQWMLALFGVKAPELPEYVPHDPGHRSYRARQVKVRKKEDESLPEPSEKAQAAFRVELFSIDYWKEPRRPATDFSETQTLFEKVFVEEELPIYYLELTAR